MTSLPASTRPLAVWSYYNDRADCENVIKELQSGFALGTLCLDSFWGTEAALSLAALTYNLTVLFQRHLGWQTKVTIHSLRFWLFVTAGIISHPKGKNDHKTGGAAARKKLVAAPLGENSQSVSQLQCSRKSTRVQRLNHGNK